MIGSWYAVQTRSKIEMACSRQIGTKGYDVFCPLASPLTRDRPPQALFPGYFFCRMAEGLDRIVTTPGVVRILRHGKVPAAIDENTISFLRKISESDIVRRPWKYIRDGCRVQITNGPLTGQQGILNRDGRGMKLIVTIEMLQRSVAAELDDHTSLVMLPDGPADSFRGHWAPSESRDERKVVLREEGHSMPSRRAAGY